MRISISKSPPGPLPSLLQPNLLLRHGLLLGALLLFGLALAFGCLSPLLSLLPFLAVVSLLCGWWRRLVLVSRIWTVFASLVVFGGLSIIDGGGLFGSGCGDL